VYVGGKMLIDIFGIHISSFLSFGIIMSAFGIAIVASLLFPKKI